MGRRATVAGAVRFLVERTEEEGKGKLAGSGKHADTRPSGPTNNTNT